MTHRHLLAVVAILVCGNGCGGRAPDMPEVGRVYGTVTLDGNPLPNVSIYFKPEVGRQSIAKANEEGYYEAMYLVDERGVKVGPNKVTLEWAPDDSGPPIPPAFGHKSTLTLDVKPGNNEFNIEMKSN